jgi:hypothetical protein
VDAQTARAIVAEVVKRGLRVAEPPPFVDESFVAQAALITDPARFKAALCTRRAGKTEGCARLLLKTAHENAGTKSLYVALTRPSAKGIMWPILKRLVRELGLDAHPNESELTLHLANGSEIILVGADSAEGLKERFKGWKFKLVVIDECASWKAHIRDLVEDVLRPTLIDLKGSMVAVGTPGEVPAGWFWEVTTGKERGWSLHKWSTRDNPYMAANFDEEVVELKARNPNVIETPTFRRNYLGEWVTESTRLVYRFAADRNLFDKLPVLDGGDVWRWVLGVDFGWDDATALVLGCWAMTQQHFFVVEAFKQSNMLLAAVDTKIRELRDRHKIRAFTHIVVDNAAKQAVEDMRDRFGWNFEPAEKSGKVGFIRAVNNDLILGKIKINAALCDQLVTELVNHIWGPPKHPGELEEPEEDPSSPNHCADSFLYSYRRARHYLGREMEPQPQPGSPEHAAKIEREMRERAAARVKAANSPRMPWQPRRRQHGF